MAKDVFVRIRGEESLSGDLKKIGAAAKGAGSDLKQLDSNLEDTGKSAGRTAEEMQQMREASRDVGLAIGVLVGGLALSGRAFRDQEIQVANLSRSYGDAADDMREWSEAIQDNTNFSNDAAVASANIASTLARNYGFTADEIQRVLNISADLAATAGIGLEDATYRVTAALRGEAEAAELLGLTMNQAAIDKENLTLTMSNEEAGHFRLNALLEQSAFAYGAAAEQADTTYGSMVDLGHGIQDAAQSLGEMLGPLGEVGAYASDNAIKLAAMGLAIGQLGKGAVAINQLTKAMTGFNIAAASPQVVASIAAIAIAAGVLYVGYEALTQQGDVTTRNMEALAEGATNTADALTLLSAAGDTVAVSLGVSAHNALTQAANDIHEMETLMGERATFQPGREDAAANAAHDANMARLDELIAKYGEWDGAAGDVAEAESDLLSVLTGTGALHEQQLTALEATNKAYKEGAITFPQYLAGLDMVADMTGNVTAAAGPATTAVGEYLAALRDVSDSSLSFPSAGAGIVSTLGDIESQAEKTQAAIDAIGGGRTDRSGTNSAQVAVNLQGAIQAARAEYDGLQIGITTASDAMTYQVGESERLAAALAKDAEALADLQTQYADTFATMQSTATQATDTLDSVFRAIVGNTDAIASQSQAVMDWADGLIGAAGTVGEIDQLLADGAITLDDYTAAQGAYNDIAAANASIQQDILSIQTQLAPYVAASTSALAEQFDSLEGAGAEAQLFALGMMDAATSSQALALAQGYIADQDTFGPLLTQAALVNPALAAILDQMGLIEYDPVEGTVSLNGVEESQSELSMLTDAMTQLDGTLATLNAILNDDASAYITDVSGLIHELDGDTATVFANLVDNASGGIAAAAAALRALDGDSATAYIYTIRSTIGDIFQTGGIVGHANGGILERASGGGIYSNGVPFIGGEAGYELVKRANGGGMAVLPSRGIYQGQPGDMVFNNEASKSMVSAGALGGVNVTIPIYGDVMGEEGFAERMAAHVAEAVVVAVDRRNRGYAL